MKSIFGRRYANLAALLVGSVATLWAAEPAPAAAGIRLQSRSWLFNAIPPEGAINLQPSEGEVATPANSTNAFSVTLRLDVKEFAAPRSILDIPEVLQVRLRPHDPADRRRQNYPAFQMSDGSVPVLEATLRLHSAEHPDWKEMTVGIPLALLKRPDGEHEVVLRFSGVRWTMYVDGQLLDNDFPFGYPQWPPRIQWKLDREFIRSATLDFRSPSPVEGTAPAPPLAPVQYWTPPGHNSWVGDVVTCFHAGRYHIFYLYDRRHHASKFGQGAHYFEHLSTEDFQTWTEHEAATPLEEQWECIGTGTPFVFHNQLCLAYGLHTGRVYPQEETTWPAQWDYLKKNGRTGAFKSGVTPGVPSGSTYAVSGDGIGHFRKSGILFHPCQNPSVYTDPHGRLRLLANAGSKGMWESDTPDSGWRCIRSEFPPGGDCTFFFRWGQFDYIIGGFTGLWSKPADAPDTAYEDVVAKGLDFYDGSNVPAITEIPAGRFLMAAWIPIRGWGGPLVLRELLQLADGRIGSKWMKEVTPPTDSPVILSPANIAAGSPVPAKSFMLSFDVRPATPSAGKLGILFRPENGDADSCELQIAPGDGRAQFAHGSLDQFARREKSLREGGAPQHAGNYAIEHLLGVGQPFHVRVIVQSTDKLGGSLVDAEIAAQRTMISYRPGLAVNKLLFRTDGVAVQNVQIAPLKN